MVESDQELLPLTDGYLILRLSAGFSIRKRVGAGEDKMEMITKRLEVELSTHRVGGGMLGTVHSQHLPGSFRLHCLVGACINVEPFSHMNFVGRTTRVIYPIYSTRDRGIVFDKIEQAWMSIEPLITRIRIAIGDIAPIKLQVVSIVSGVEKIEPIALSISTL